MGEWRIFEPFFSLYEFFLGRSMNIFLGLIGVHEFFSFKFPLREYFFFVLRPPPPPPPITFLMVRPQYRGNQEPPSGA